MKVEVEAIGKDTDLLAKREELKHQLATGKYKTLVKMIADRTGYLIQRFTRSSEPVPFWYSLLTLTLTSLLLGFLISSLLGELRPSSEAISFWLLGLSFNFIMLFTIEVVCINLCISFARSHLVDAMDLVADLADFQHWLAATFSIRKQFFFGLIFSVSLFFYAIIFTPRILIEFIVIGFGLAIPTTIWTILVGSYFYFFLQGLPLVVRFSNQYQFKLYAVDPSSSEFIDQLSDILSYGVYIAAGFVAILTLLVSLYNLLAPPVIILSILLGWIPVIAFFVANQYVLARIITRAKWKTLHGIQAQIEELQAQEHILSEKTLAHLDKLMDYHDRIRATRNSAFDIRTGLNFVNSLLLPVIAFILANLDQIIELFFS